MEKLFAILFWVLVMICALGAWYIYHKIFKIYYFDLFRGCMMEIFGCGFAGVVLAFIIVKFWYIAIIPIAILIVGIVKKTKGKH